MSRCGYEGALWGAELGDWTPEKELACKAREEEKKKTDARKRVKEAITTSGFACCKDLALLRIRGESYQFGPGAKAVDFTRKGKFEVSAKLLDTSYFDL